MPLLDDLDETDIVSDSASGYLSLTDFRVASSLAISFRCASHADLYCRMLSWTIDNDFSASDLTTEAEGMVVNISL